MTVNCCVVCETGEHLNAVARRLHPPGRTTALSAAEVAEYQEADRRHKDALWQAERHAWARLLSFLPAEAASALISRAHFDVTGSEGNQYRVFAKPSTDNVARYIRRPVVGLWVTRMSCLQPALYTSRPDALLTQAMTLRMSETDFMSTAFSRNMDSPISWFDRDAYYGPWGDASIPPALIAAYTGKDSRE